jgi:hypothetical protein
LSAPPGVDEFVVFSRISLNRDVTKLASLLGDSSRSPAARPHLIEPHIVHTSSCRSFDRLIESTRTVGTLHARSSSDEAILLHHRTR